MHRSPGHDSSGAPTEVNAAIAVIDLPTAGVVNIKLTAAATVALAPADIPKRCGGYARRQDISLPSLSIMVVARNWFAQ
jgi:hypothetical protein